MVGGILSALHLGRALREAVSPKPHTEQRFIFFSFVLGRISRESLTDLSSLGVLSF